MKKLPKINLSKKLIASIEENNFDLEQFKGGSYQCGGSAFNACGTCTTCNFGGGGCVGFGPYTCQCPSMYTCCP